jgi:hypothetical protein
MGRILDDYASTHSDAVIRRGGETFVAAERADEVITEAERQGVRVLGLEGFLISDSAVYPAPGRIADLSNASLKAAARAARDLLAGGWATPPMTSDQMHSDGVGRHMLAIVLDD